MAVLICPACGSDMQEKRKNFFLCRCGSKFRQVAIDTTPYRHKIINARKSAGLDVEDAALRLGVTAAHLKRLERGRYNLATYMKRKMAKLYKCQVGDLID